MCFQFEAMVLRFGVGVLFELYNQVVAVAFGESRFAYKQVALLLELDRFLSVLGVGNNSHGLTRSRNRLQSGIVKCDGYGVVLLQKKLGLRVGFLEQA